MMET
jgi:hypothetical protein